jgi:site-specific DNA-methyltransferase (adenine-specific)
VLQIGLEQSVDTYLDNLMKVFDESKRVLRDDGSLWVVIGDTYINGCLGSVPHRFTIRMMEHGWIQRNCVVWHKTNPKPESVKTRLSTSHEFIFFFTKTMDYYFDIDSIRQPYKDKGLDDIRSPRHHSLNGDIQIHTPVIQNPLGKTPQDFIEESKHSFGIGKKLGIDDIEHGAVYPPSLCYQPIKSCTKKGDLVLDCFSGSGTTGEVSLELGREYVGYEINSKFVQLSEMRLNKSFSC